MIPNCNLVSTYNSIQHLTVKNMLNFKRQPPFDQSKCYILQNAFWPSKPFKKGNHKLFKKSQAPQPYMLMRYTKRKDIYIYIYLSLLFQPGLRQWAAHLTLFAAWPAVGSGLASWHSCLQRGRGRVNPFYQFYEGTAGSNEWEGIFHWA